MANETITVSTDLLEAVARWAHGDLEHMLGAVVFRDGKMTAGDNTKIVQVPVETNGLTFGVARAHLLAAVAAQAAIARDDIEPKIAHDQTTNDHGEQVLTDGPHSDRTISLKLASDRVIIDIGAVRLSAPSLDISQFPTATQIEAATKGGTDGTPDGHVLDPRFLIAVHEVNVASGCFHGGARFVSWNRLKDGQPVGSLVAENEAGVRFVMMPMRPWKEGA